MPREGACSTVCCGQTRKLEPRKEGGYRTRHEAFGKQAVVKRENMWGFNVFFLIPSTLSVLISNLVKVWVV